MPAISCAIPARSRGCACVPQPWFPRNAQHISSHCVLAARDPMHDLFPACARRCLCDSGPAACLPACLLRCSEGTRMVAPSGLSQLSCYLYAVQGTSWSLDNDKTAGALAGGAAAHAGMGAPRAQQGRGKDRVGTRGELRALVGVWGLRGLAKSLGQRSARGAGVLAADLVHGHEAGRVEAQRLCGRHHRVQISLGRNGLAVEQPQPAGKGEKVGWRGGHRVKGGGIDTGAIGQAAASQHGVAPASACASQLSARRAAASYVRRARRRTRRRRFRGAGTRHWASPARVRRR